LHSYFVQIKGIGGLIIAEDQQFVAFEIESEESCAAADYKIGVAISGVEVVNRDLSRKVFDRDLVSLRI
jgi:hypothetical protein